MVAIAVYGGNGYAGEAVRAEAVRRGHEVVVVSRSGTTRTGRGAPDAIAGDIHELASVSAVVESADVVIVAIPGYEIDGKRLVDAIAGLLAAAERGGTRVGVIGGSGTLLASESGPRLMDADDFPAAAMPSAQGHAAVLDVLRENVTGSWFYVSPPVIFGAHVPQAPTGAYLLGGDVLRRDANGDAVLSVEDLALAVVDEIEHPRYENVRFSVIGAY